MLPALVFIINGIFLLIALWLAYRMFRAADMFNKNQGDGEIQGPLRWKMLWSIFFLLILALIASIFNAGVSWFIPTSIS